MSQEQPTLDHLNGQFSQHIRQLQQKIQAAKRFSLKQQNLATPGSRLYIRGEFREFDPNYQAVDIYFDNRSNWYPLACYEGERIPRPDTPALIVQNGQRPAIFGYQEMGEMIPIAPRISMQVRSFNLHQGVLLGQLEQMAGIQRLSIEPELLQGLNLYPGCQLQLRMIEQLPDLYLIPEAGPERPTHDRHKLLQNCMK